MPTRPTSVMYFNSIKTCLFSPLCPLSKSLGALFLLDLKKAFPWPPFPPLQILKISPGLIQSKITALVIASLITEPNGRLIVVPFPFAP